MDDRYDLFACIDFGTDSYSISLPVLKRRNSNYFYIPKTDNHFIVMDFYEIHDLGYALQYVNASDENVVQIGHKAPVPVVEEGQVYVINPDWTEAEIRDRLPRLGNEAVKAFLSLRSRLGIAPTHADHADLRAEMDDLLSEPVSSRYWISKVSALVRSAFARGEPSAEFLERVENARLKWLEKFAVKSTLKLVQGVLDIPHLKLQPDSTNRVMLHRCERLLLTKGIHISRTELRAYERMFPDGIFEAIRRDEIGDPYGFWRRRNAISDFVASQTYELVYPSDITQSRIQEPNRWSVIELSSVLLFCEVIARNDTGLDIARQYFLPLFNKCLEQVQIFLGDRYRLSSAIFQTQPPPPWFVREILEALRIPLSKFPHSSDEWLNVLREIVELHRKLVIISKIVRPNTVNLEDKSVGFEGVDYALLSAVNNAVATQNVSAIRAVLAPDPRSIR